MPSTGKGFPYPSSSDNPNIPADFQALAEAIDTELNSYSLTDANTQYHFEGASHDEEDDFDLQLISNDVVPVVDTVHFKGINGVVLTWDETNQRVTFSAGADLAAIEALTGTSGLLKKTAANTWELDTNTYSTTSHSHTLDGLSDVVISSATNGQVLKFDGTNWVNGTDNTGTSGGGGNAFTIIAVPSGTNPEAGSSTDTLTLSAGTGITITGNSGTDTITFALDADLSGIASATLTSSGFLKTNGSGTFSVDTATYITGSSPTISTPALTLSTTSNTADGRLSWDTAYHHAYIGDGTNLTLVPTFRVQATAKTGAYTLVAGDANTLIQMNASAAFTVPASGTTDYTVGTQLHLVALTTGVTVKGATSSVLINGADRSVTGLSLRAAYSAATLIKIATDSWILLGDLS